MSEPAQARAQAEMLFQRAYAQLSVGKLGMVAMVIVCHRDI